MKRLKTALTLTVLSVLLLFLTSHMPGAADFYGENIYPLFLHTLGRFFGLLPWSAAEWILYALILCALILLGKAVWKWGKRAPDRAAYTKSSALNLLLAAAILFTTFALTEGPNYYRTPFAAQIGMGAREYSTQELTAVYQSLIEKGNTLAAAVARDERGLMENPSGAGEQAMSAMEKLGQAYPSLGGYYPRPKPVILSQALSLLDITGIYTPFTVEANYNRDVVDYNQPFTMCHELSHLKGFMPEEEANFIAYLACEVSDCPEFRYSGVLMGMIYSGNELYRRDREAYLRLQETICPEIHADFAANSRYWDQYEGLTAAFSRKVNDVYLKVNRQTEGIKSYDRVVDLIVQHELKNAAAGAGEAPGVHT